MRATSYIHIGSRKVLVYERVGSMLEIKSLTKVISRRPIIKNVSLTLNDGEIMAVLGPNGAGKSTLFKCVAGLLKPTNGEIMIDGKKLKTGSVSAKKRIGFLGHDSFLYSNMTPVENLMFYGKLYRVNDLENKIERLLKETGLFLFKDVPVGSFSKGMVQKLAIARVLLPEPEILLLDEPHSGLDQSAVLFLNRYILDRKKTGKSVLFISHDLNAVYGLADRAVVLKNGKIVEASGEGGWENLDRLKTWYEQAVAG